MTDARLDRLSRRTGVSWLKEQREDIDAQTISDAFDAPESQIALPTLDTAHIGPVKHEPIREGLLTQPKPKPIGAQIPANAFLQRSFHGPNAAAPLPNGLQTYEYLRRRWFARLM